MIFNSNEIKNLWKKYQGIPQYKLPEILLLGQLSDFKKERFLLENLFQQIPKNKQKNLLPRLISADDGQHLGAWLELRLFGWLSEIGKTSFEPDIKGETPDYLLEYNNKHIYLESKFIQKAEKDKQLNFLEEQIYSLLHQINKPYSIFVKETSLSEINNEKDFVIQVLDWLEHNPTNIFDYGDDNKGHIILEASFFETLDHVVISGPISFYNINSKPITNPLEKKAKQHSALRKSGFPYIIMIMADSPLISAEEIVNAWFGNLHIIFDINTNKVIEQTFDKSGLHYFKDTIVHKSISGTLFFKRALIDTSYQLQSWWIQNPYAEVPLLPNLFPTIGEFIRNTQYENEIRMGWIYSSKE